MNIKAIGFDYSGVMAHIPGRPWKEMTAEIFDAPLITIAQAYGKLNHLLNSGTMSPEDFWRMFATEIDRIDKLPQFMKYVETMADHVIDVEMTRLVDNLRAKGYRTGLLSNYDAAGAAAVRASGIDQHFDLFIASADVGYSKPDPKLFELFAAKLGVELSELAFTDDRSASLSRATEAGYHPILFTGIENLKHDLEKLGVAVS